MQRKLNANYFDMFDSKLIDLGKIADNLGVEKPKYTIINEEYITETNINGNVSNLIPSFDKIITVNVDFPEINLNAWKVVGHIIHNAADRITVPLGKLIGNDLIIAFSDLPENYYQNNFSLCDHCNKIMNKTDMYILESQSGELKTVSSPCISNFTSSSKVFSMFEFITAFEALMVFNPEKETINIDTVANKSHSWYRTEDIIPYAVYVIRKYGWVSKSNSQICNSERKASSEWFVDIVFNNKGNVDISEYKQYVEPIRNFYRTHQDEFKHQMANSDLNAIISESLNGDYINFAKTRKTAGMICYAVHQYDTMDISYMPNSKHIASIGDTITIIGKMIFSKITMNYFGKSLRISLNCDGSRVEFYTSIKSVSAEMLKMCSTGDIIQLRGIVKNHSVDNNNVKTTELTRIKILKVTKINKHDL